MAEVLACSSPDLFHAAASVCGVAEMKPGGEGERKEEKKKGSGQKSEHKPRNVS